MPRCRIGPEHIHPRKIFGGLGMKRGKVGADASARDNERNAPGNATADEGDDRLDKAPIAPLEQDEQEDGNSENGRLNANAGGDAREKSAHDRGPKGSAPLDQGSSRLWRIAPQEQGLRADRQRKARHIAHRPEPRHPEQRGC